MTNKEADKLLVENGFQKVRQKGSHVVYSNGEHLFTIIQHSSPKERLRLKQIQRLNKLLKQVKK